MEEWVKEVRNKRLGARQGKARDLADEEDGEGKECAEYIYSNAGMNNFHHMHV